VSLCSLTHLLPIKMAAIISSQIATVRPCVALKTAASSRATAVRAVPRAESSLKKALVGAGVGVFLAAQVAVLPALALDIPNPFQGSIEETREASRMPATRGEIGGAARAKGEQANQLQRAAGEATGRDGSQIPDKMQQVGDQSGSPK